MSCIIAQYLGISRGAILKSDPNSFGLWWSDWAEIQTRPSFYKYLGFVRGVFENFDFSHNGGHFKSIMAAILNLKWPPLWLKSKFSKIPLTTPVIS